LSITEKDIQKKREEYDIKILDDSFELLLFEDEDFKKLDKKKTQLSEKIMSTKEKLLKDEKLYHKRTTISIKDEGESYLEYVVRITDSYKQLNKKKMLTGLVPHSIHSYDASIMCQVVEITADLGIGVCVIHDSIGCRQEFIPLIRTLFKIVNIHFLEKNIKNPVFPYIKNSMSEDEAKFLFLRMYESHGFFK